MVRQRKTWKGRGSVHTITTHYLNPKYQPRQLGLAGDDDRIGGCRRFFVIQHKHCLSHVQRGIADGRLTPQQGNEEIVKFFDLSYHSYIIAISSYRCIGSIPLDLNAYAVLSE